MVAKHAWHAQKSRHNYDTYRYLKRENPRYVDWEVILLFYSACKLIDAYFIMYEGRKPRHHSERNTMVENYLPEIRDEYSRLYDLSKIARYDRDLSVSDIARAVALHRHITGKLSPRVNSNTQLGP